MKRLLITGANSYVGLSVRDYLSKWPEAYKIDMASMRDGSWRNLDLSVYDVVYHVAGIAHVDRGKISPEREKLYYAVNTDLAVEVAEKAKASGVKQFIYMSSLIVYGDSSAVGMKKRITKETPVSPKNCYGDSKVKAEEGLRGLENAIFKVAIIRAPMIYGSGCKGNYPILSKIAQKIPVFPKTNNERSMLYIVNLAEFVRLLIDNEDAGTFWPQNAEYTDTADLVKMIAQVHGRRVIFLSGFTPLLKMMSKRHRIIASAFGSLSMDMSASKYRQNYQIVSFVESIKLTEHYVEWESGFSE